MSALTVAALQMACGPDRDANVARAEGLIRRAAAEGAQIVLPQELFADLYFPRSQRAEALALAEPAEGHPLLARMADLARELGVVLPVSFYERANNARFNALAVIDADGRNLGLYRKSHIPDGPGYQEKFYFSPGDTGFRVWDTAAGRIGVGICWDQWFPEAARAMALKGAEVILYPTAIGTEPKSPALDSAAHWRRVMQGHAGANLVPLVAANRIGTEGEGTAAQTFYGQSFIAGAEGEIVSQAGNSEETVVSASFDLAALSAKRASWGVFRDRRPELYRTLLSLDGTRIG